MTALAKRSHPQRLQRLLIVGIATVCALLLAAGIVLWAKLGTAVFFDMIAAGIAYCF
jgi:cytochrome b subunit of formate dehydrogenase